MNTRALLLFARLMVFSPRIPIEAVRCGIDTTRRLLAMTYRICVATVEERPVVERRDCVPAPTSPEEMEARVPWGLEHSPMFLVRVHPIEKCAPGPCPIHNRTDHTLRSWPQFFRQDAGFMERTCRHGIGHPDPDCKFAPPVHGCDGCCSAGDAPELGAEHLPEAS